MTTGLHASYPTPSRSTLPTSRHHVSRGYASRLHVSRFTFHASGAHASRPTSSRFTFHVSGRSTPRPPSLHRGSALLQLIAGLFVAGLVLTLAVPLYLTGVRRWDAGLAQSRMREQARRVTSRLREDVRQAATLQVASDGAALRLALRRPGGVVDQVSYAFSGGVLVRDLHPGAGRAAEQDVYAAPLTRARFSRSGPGVRAQFFFDQQLYGRHLGFSADCVAVPRSAL